MTGRASFVTTSLKGNPMGDINPADITTAFGQSEVRAEEGQHFHVYPAEHVNGLHGASVNVRLDRPGLAVTFDDDGDMLVHTSLHTREQLQALYGIITAALEASDRDEILAVASEEE